MSLDLNRQTWGVDTTATADEKQKATRYVASIAVNKDDCRHLLDILGLLPNRLAITEHGMRGYRQGCTCPVCRKANAHRNQKQRATTTADVPINTTTRGTTS